MRITTKGHVAIPQDIREAVGLLPHTEVEFVIDGERVVLRKASGENQGRGIPPEHLGTRERARQVRRVVICELAHDEPVRANRQAHPAAMSPADS
jgi:AbrB family looped-hinge helix DNA binding protein